MRWLTGRTTIPPRSFLPSLPPSSLLLSPSPSPVDPTNPPPTPPDSLFSLKFTAKQLAKQSSKASKDEQKEIEKLKKALQKGNSEGAKIYASNAIRKKNESLNLLRLSSRIDAVTSRVQTAVTMRAVTGSMGKVVQGMDVAMRTMDLEKISLVMDKFEQQFTDLDVQTGYMEETMNDTTAVSTPQDQVDLLMQKVRVCVWVGGGTVVEEGVGAGGRCACASLPSLVP